MEILDKTIPHTDISALNILIAIIVFIIGMIIVKIIINIFKKSLRKSKLPDLVVEFMARLIGALLKIAVILSVASALGFNTDAVVISFTAVIGLILAFGLQDSFNNLFSGIWIAALRPIDKDEYVGVAGHEGTVTAVCVMATEFLTVDNKLITIPNKLVWGQPIVNYTRMPTRRVDVSVGIAYDSPVDKAYKIAIDLMKIHPLVLDDPKAAVVMTELADSSVNLQLRAWTNTENYWQVKGDLTEGILAAYNKTGINIPFPQLDVHMTKQ